MNFTWGLAKDDLGKFNIRPEALIADKNSRVWRKRTRQLSEYTANSSTYYSVKSLSG